FLVDIFYFSKYYRSMEKLKCPRKCHEYNFILELVSGFDRPLKKEFHCECGFSLREYSRKFPTNNITQEEINLEYLRRNK
ncbi:MAG: hypothetical protein WCO84_05860, partial [bacterium]